MSDIRQWLDYNHLLLNEAKTEAIVFFVPPLSTRLPRCPPYVYAGHLYHCR